EDFFLLDSETGVKIPAVFLTSKVAMPPYPVVLYLHAHGGRYELGKSEIFRPRAGEFIPADELTKHGFAVMVIDAYAFEERQSPDEMTLFKRFLWEGKTLWGMMLRDDLIALDYLNARADVDHRKICAMGMSMGSTRAFWLAALDATVTTTVAVACLTRYTDLIAADGLNNHDVYFYVPGMLMYFDVETIVSLIAPHRLLCLNGDRDPTSPVSGIRTITDEVASIYALYGAEDRFQSVIYPDLGHAFTPEMFSQSLSWLITGTVL
ncbi:MAG: dienelactone hydrolase family protein, partial [Chloroflexota bacterium]